MRRSTSSTRRLASPAAIVPVALLVALPLACAQVLGDDFSIGSGAGGQTTGGTGGGTSSGGGGQTTSGSGGGTGGGGGETTCGNLFPGNGPDCDSCISNSCCAEAIACLEDVNCSECIAYHDPASCAAVGAEFYAFNQCWAENCSGEICYPKSDCNAPAAAPSDGGCFEPGANDSCNPVNGAGCGPAEQCLANSGGFYCAAYPNVSGLCQPCDNPSGIVCDATMMCVFNTTCARFCCDNGDCGGGWCVYDVSQNPHTEVGICVQAPSFYF